MVPQFKRDPSYKVDEGYSEETRSQDGLDSPTDMEQDGDNLLQSQMLSATGLSSAVAALNEAEKAGIPVFAWALQVVDRLWPLFHKDPVMIFPSEIISQIFSYLTPPMLLEASRASRAWRERILDNGLWKRKFNTEGWSLDAEQIQSFEKTYNQRCYANASTNAAKGTKGKERAFRRESDKGAGNTERAKSPQDTPTPYRMQARAKFLSPGLQTLDGQGLETGSQYGLSDDCEMPDVEIASPKSSAQGEDISPGNGKLFDFLHARELQKQTFNDLSFQGIDSFGSPPDEGLEKSPAYLGSPMMWGMPGLGRLNYHHVFKQKRKLEHNWDTGQYKSFQLPHRDHPEDAHTECVYTIQYSRKYLVSGSRDRTLRIWDLDTQRLVRAPLQGHTGSVLCLQFDDDEKEDLIVSGSSDESVILWRFSTGQMIKKLAGAHKESVLNLKFDERFLVTCSKDKTIKIWNRRQLRPGDRDYPQKSGSNGGPCPDYILDMKDISVALREPYLFPDKPALLEPYTHLMTLELHGAAVNAIQIFNDELVSASGDRNIRVWNIHTGESSTKMEAHTKGIACVQYDGMRIVSGSSDRTIRIWDPISKTEVARLDGHTNLVRTIQAAFADYPGGRKNLESEALEVERNFQAASIAGLIDPESGRKSRGTPGSRKPKDFKSVGAKIPPSGGGGKWGRIVSGSYDETIIIWKKTEDDEWVIGHRLRQEEALRAAGPPLIPRSDTQAQAQATGDPADHTHNNHQASSAASAQTPIQTAGVQGPIPAHQVAQSAMQASNATAPPGPSLQQPPSDGNDSQVPLPSSSNNHALARAYQQLVQGQQPGTQASLQNHLQVAGTSNNTPNAVPAGQQQRLRVASRPPAGGQGNQVPQVGQPNARVFKLQFDARRIICCSQDPKIVGWDFANGDEEIMECSRFFAAPQ
ncbi:hypothetical protein ACLMJK_005536 [Lecanora helva]